ncbi:MAG TPA: hypothetical protein GX739_06205 [Firmicutes bacterium]|nr:hypothetical protein [Bacillota bacterium]
MPELTMVDLAVLLLLFIVYISFSIGYLQGCKHGKREGQIEEVLALKERSLLLGKCTLCGYMQDSEEILAKNGIVMKDS